MFAAMRLRMHGNQPCHLDEEQDCGSEARSKCRNLSTGRAFFVAYLRREIAKTCQTAHALPSFLPGDTLFVPDSLRGGLPLVTYALLERGGGN